MTTKLDKKEYANNYGPTEGDKVRLGNSNLLIQIEKNFITYGEEVKTGLLGNLGDLIPYASGEEYLDTVITNVIIFDYLVIVKADIGFKNGVIVGVGNAGVQSIQKNITSRMYIGPETTVIDGTNKILTPGIVDSSLIMINDNIMSASLKAGVTTLCYLPFKCESEIYNDFNTNNKKSIHDFYKNYESHPQNLSILGRCSSDLDFSRSLRISIENGIAGVYHFITNKSSLENLSSEIDHIQSEGLPIFIHSDIRGVGTSVTSILEKLTNRTINLLCPSGMIGGCVPNNLELLSNDKIIPFSFSFSHAWKVFDANSSPDEFIIKINGLNHFNDKEQVENLFMPPILGGEEYLFTHGGIPATSSGCVSEEKILSFVKDTLDSYSIHKKIFGNSSEGDNEIAKSFISQLTINPAISFGIDSYIGSIEINKRADVLLWDFDKFGDVPDAVFVGGESVYSRSSELNSVVKHRDNTGVRFVSMSSLYKGIFNDIASNFLSVKAKKETDRGSYITCDKVSKIKVDPETYAVSSDGTFLNHTIYNSKTPPQEENPGEVFVDSGEIFINQNSNTADVAINNRSISPLIIGSHTMYTELNNVETPEIETPGVKATDLLRLDIPAGSSVVIRTGATGRVKFLIK